MTRELAAAQRRVAEGPVIPAHDPAAFHRALDEFDFTRPRPLGHVLRWVIAQMEHGIVHVDHPRYFGLFNPAPNFPAQCAERVSATFNPQLASATTSPCAVAIERHTLGAMCRRFGLPSQANGHFTTGGAEANFTAMLCALLRACETYAADGVRAFGGAPAVYVSRDSHRSWVKIAHASGIGRSAVRLIETDGSGRMSVSRLVEAIAADREAGAVPVMIVATAGTTSAGMRDPLQPCADVARREDVWLHVDAAWGGAAVVSDRLRHLLDGIGRADSITFDAHKWLATTMGCGMFLTAWPALLPRVFGVATSYMPPSPDADAEPFATSLQWSRRHLGLRLFMALATAGWTGYAAHVERSVALAARLRDALVERGWRVVNDPALGVVCAEPPRGCRPPRDIVHRVLSSGSAWISTTEFEGRPVIRACITNGNSGEDDVTALVQALVAAA